MTRSDQILQQIKKIITEKEPNATIYLYGSRARGKAGKDSDWDILILLDRNEITPEIERSVTYPLYDLEFDTGEIISPMVYSAQEWFSKYRITPFFYNVMKEGKKL